eukprot:CAMPEP_0201696904 /NCGR_PEP_ID=MMETSP0578-20130828/8392_1 /ASSEMBLY_ACC=CAM_ASM_000663 /TAXON_ID=267565 /ORGANISM="Skeletonema grethea, Strain CCMP 1804" /LENGTH=554 /DNA_ID=CAMNT_0048182939 /DNA_START=123 /DNA_END=1787 /DNA_ORIENTATION=+
MKIKHILSSKRSGSLLKGNGLSSSDDFQSRSESSSSLSKRQPKKSSFPSKLFRKSKTVAGLDGYESDADASTNSTRSTSSSFLRYQNKFLKLKSVFERRGDGSEVPVQTKSKLPSIFDRIYNRQNTIDDNYASDESEEDTSAPPEIICEEIICSELVDDPSTLFVDKTPAKKDTQESIDVSCGEKQIPAVERSLSKVKYPSQQLTQTLLEPATATEDKEQGINAKPSRSKPKKKRIKKTAKLLAPVPVSIPRTISYSLRSAISDGSKRERNSHSLMERRAFRVNGSHIDTSYWSHRGKRAYMEDRYVIEYMGATSKDRKKAKPMTLIGVFDGHGGAEASQFCSDWLSSYIRKDKDYPSNISAAMKSAFTTVDKDFVASGFLDGSTACACSIIGDEKVICCNAGDTRAIIVKKNGSFVPLSEDHKPDRSDETTRINELGGRVIHWGRWRVEGVLAVSRSIGDARLKPYVTAEPDIVEHTIQDDDMFLVIASDGVWDTMSSDLVAKFCLVNTCKIVEKDLVVDDSLFRWIARQISKRARENGSSDNTSVIVASLRK